MNGTRVESKKEEKDLGVIVSNDLNPSKKCLAARNKANKMLGIIRRNVSYKSKQVITKLYDCYVRPHLEYCIQAWSPYLRKNIDMVDSIQRRASKLVAGLRHMTYEDRLKELNWIPINKRRLMLDLVEVYRLLHNIDSLRGHNLFELCHENRTRGHNWKIRKPMCRLDARKYSFAARVVDQWNNLPFEVVNSSSLKTFKTTLESHLLQ